MKVIKEAIGSTDVEVFFGEWNVDADANEWVALSAIVESPLTIFEIAGSVADEQIDPVEP